MRAVGNATVGVLRLTGDVHSPPARPGRQHDRSGLECCATLELDANEAVVGLDELRCTLVHHDVHVVASYVLLELGSEPRTLGVRRRDQVLDAEGVEQLPAEALGDDPRADALACGVHRSRRARGTSADDQHVERVLGVELCRNPIGRSRIDLAEDLFEAHPTLIEQFTVGEHGRHGHDGALFDFVGEQRSVDRDVLDVRVDHAHQVERLNDIGAVLTRQRHECLEPVDLIDPSDLLDHVGRGGRRMASDLQEGEYQRGELVTHRDPGEAHRHVGAEPVDRERGAAPVVTCRVVADRLRERSNLGEEVGELGRLCRVVE